MKKILFFILLFVVSISLVYCGTKDRELAKIQKEPEVQISTNRVITQGTVKVFNEETGKWESAVQGEIELKKNTEIKTSDTGSMKVEITKNNFVAISGGSEVKIKTLERTKLSKRERIALQLLKGKLDVKVRHLKKAEYFKVVTPVATAGVRGTKFDVSILPDNATEVMCVSGSVDVKSRLKKRQSVVIGDFEKVIVNSKGVIMPKEKLTKAEIEKIMNISFDEFLAGIAK